MRFIVRMFTPPKPKTPEAPKPPAPPTRESAEEAAKEELKKKKRAMAGQETVYTSPLGLAGAAEVTRKKLLGE